LATNTTPQNNSAKTSKTQYLSAFEFSPRYKSGSLEYVETEDETYNWRDNAVIDIKKALEILKDEENLVRGSPRIYLDKEFPSNWSAPGKELEEETLLISNLHAEQELDGGTIEYHFRTYERKDGKELDEVKIKARYHDEIEEEIKEKVTNTYNNILEQSEAQELQIEKLKAE